MGTIEDKAGKVEKVLEEKGSEQAIKAVRDETANMSPEEKAQFLTSLKEQNEKAPKSVPTMTAEQDPKTGDVNVTFRQTNLQKLFAQSKPGADASPRPAASPADASPPPGGDQPAATPIDPFEGLQQSKGNEVLPPLRHPLKQVGEAETLEDGKTRTTYTGNLKDGYIHDTKVDVTRTVSPSGDQETDLNFNPPRKNMKFPGVPDVEAYDVTQMQIKTSPPDQNGNPQDTRVEIYTKYTNDNNPPLHFRITPDRKWVQTF